VGKIKKNQKDPRREDSPLDSRAQKGKNLQVEMKKEGEERQEVSE